MSRRLLVVALLACLLFLPGASVKKLPGRWYDRWLPRLWDPADVTALPQDHGGWPANNGDDPIVSFGIGKTIVPFGITQRTRGFGACISDDTVVDDCDLVYVEAGVIQEWSRIEFGTGRGGGDNCSGDLDANGDCCWLDAPKPYTEMTYDPTVGFSHSYWVAIVDGDGTCPAADQVSALSYLVWEQWTAQPGMLKHYPNRFAGHIEHQFVRDGVLIPDVCPFTLEDGQVESSCMFPIDVEVVEHGITMQSNSGIQGGTNFAKLTVAGVEQVDWRIEFGNLSSGDAECTDELGDGVVDEVGESCVKRPDQYRDPFVISAGQRFNHQVSVGIAQLYTGVHWRARPLNFRGIGQ